MAEKVKKTGLKVKKTASKKTAKKVSKKKPVKTAKKSPAKKTAKKESIAIWRKAKPKKAIEEPADKLLVDEAAIKSAEFQKQMVPEVVCPDCSGKSMVTDYKHGEIVCKNCGTVIEDGMFDFGPEWRAFDEEQKSKRARTGGPVKFAKLNKGLTTEIDRYDRDIRGGAIQPERKAQLYRLRKWQRRSRMSDSVQRNLSIALPELDRMCAYLNIPNNIKEECAMWYRKAVSKGLVRGRSIESVVAAIIYLISRKHQLPKTLEELADASGVKKKDIGRSYRFACRRLELKMPVATPMDYVPRFASELGLSGETEAKAIEILELAREKGVTSGRGPTGVAAAAIYLAGKLTNDKQTQKGMAGRLAGVTEVTIRNRYEEIARELKLDI